MDGCVAETTPIEQWFMKMETAVAQRQIMLALPTDEGAVLALTRYASMGAYLAGCELVDDIKAMLSHIRAARVAPAKIAFLDDLVGCLEAERIHGRSRLTDCLVVAPRFGAPRAVPPAFPTRRGDPGSRAKV